jgi:hypothetical protein
MPMSWKLCFHGVVTIYGLGVIETCETELRDRCVPKLELGNEGTQRFGMRQSKQDLK